MDLRWHFYTCLLSCFSQSALLTFAFSSPPLWIHSVHCFHYSVFVLSSLLYIWGKKTCLSVSSVLLLMRWPLVSCIPRLLFIVYSWLPFFPWSVLLYNQSWLYFSTVCLCLFFISMQIPWVQRLICSSLCTQHLSENLADNKCSIKVYGMEKSELWEDLWSILSALTLDYECESLSSQKIPESVFFFMNYLFFTLLS